MLSVRLRVFGAFLCAATVASAFTWPIPYQRHTSRPPSDPFCKAEYPFCPTGFPAGYYPPIADNDTLDVFILKAPVWEFKVGDLLGVFHIIHDAIGFRSHQTGRNYTTEWYELYELFNCTFPHTLAGQKTPIWCNQGATCFYPGIDDHHWTESKYGTLTKVAEVTGQQFNNLTSYLKWDNDTGIYYETWRVRSSAGPNFTEWFNPFECADYVIRVFQKFGEMGVKFTTSSAMTPPYLAVRATPLWRGSSAHFTRYSRPTGHCRSSCCTCWRST